MLNRLLDGFEGKLTSSKWAKIEKCSQDTALRDIDDLVDRKILVKDPGRRPQHQLFASQRIVRYRFPAASAPATAALISASVNGFRMTSWISASRFEARSRWSA